MEDLRADVTLKQIRSEAGSKFPIKATNMRLFYSCLSVSFQGSFQTSV